MAESEGSVTPDRRGGAGGAEVIPQCGSRIGTVEGKPGLDRRGVGEERLCAIAFPFFVILFTGAGVCVYLGAIAWLPALRREETSPEEA